AGMAGSATDKPSALGKPISGNSVLPHGAALPPIETPGFHFESTSYQSPQLQKGTVSPAPSSPAVSGRPGEEPTEYPIELEPPGPQVLFRLDSEPAMQERIRQKA